MDYEQMQRFVIKNHKIYSTPIHIGDFILATDGYAVIRVHMHDIAIPEEENVEVYPEQGNQAVEKMIDMFTGKDFIAGTWLPMAEIALPAAAISECLECRGKIINYTCPECGGVEKLLLNLSGIPIPISTRNATAMGK
jgi:hypothetical protein